MLLLKCIRVHWIRTNPPPNTNHNIYYFHRSIGCIKTYPFVLQTNKTPPPIPLFLQIVDLGFIPSTALLWNSTEPAMDCKCGCLARMALVEDTCVYAEGLELTNTEWRSMLGCLMIPNRGFRAPLLHRLTTADLQESWVCFSPHNFGHNIDCKYTSEYIVQSICFSNINKNTK